MRLEFEKIRYKNFLAVGENAIEIRFDKSPHTLICGNNAAGKSTLIEALSFVLFGKSYRGINKNGLVNSVNGRQCLVEVWFKKGNDSYHISRGISPNILTITKNGQMLDIDSSSKLQQAHIENNILCTDFKMFSHMVIVGASTYAPFMQLTASQRREMVEGILNIGIFADMNVALKKRISVWKEEYRDNISETESLQREISILTESIKRLSSSNELTISNKKQQIQKLKETAKPIKEIIDMTSVSNTDKAEAKLRELQSKKQSSNLEIGKLDFEVAGYREMLSFLLNNDNCPTCTQIVDKSYSDSKIEELESLIASVTNKINEAKTQRDKISAFIESIQNRLETNKNAKIKLDTATRKIENIASTIKMIKSEIASLIDTETESTGPQQIMLNEKNTQMSKLKEDAKQLLVDKKVLDIATTLLKDDGIKAKIVSKYIPILNHYVNNYLRLLNFNITFQLDNNFNESLNTRYKNEFKYSNFSMGERQRLDMALMFAWIAVAQKKASMSTNLLILDEVEGHLDKSGSDDVLTIIESLNDMNVFVISHKETMQDRIRSIIRFSKENGFTKMVK